MPSDLTETSAFTSPVTVPTPDAEIDRDTWGQHLNDAVQALTNRTLYLKDNKSDTSHNHDLAYSALGHTHDDRYYLDSEVDTLLLGKSDVGHLHDERYYTETEIDTALALKSDTSHNHDAAYSPLGHLHDDRYYTETEIDTALALKSDATHNHDAVYLALSGGTMTGGLVIDRTTTHILLREAAVDKWHMESVSGVFKLVQTGVADKVHVSATGLGVRVNPIAELDVLQASPSPGAGLAVRSATTATNVAGNLWAGTGGFVIDARLGDLSGGANLHLRTGGSDRIIIHDAGQIEVNLPFSTDLSIIKNEPWFTLDSSSAGSSTVEQAAGISIGEAGTKGGASLHLTYIGTGYSYIGMGEVSGGVPANWAMELFYTENRVTFNGRTVHLGRLEPGQLATGSVVVGGNAYWTPATPGVYNVLSGASQGVRLSFFAAGAWRETSRNDGHVTFSTDGSAVRVKNMEAGNATLYWQRLGG